MSEIQNRTISMLALKSGGNLDRSTKSRREALLAHSLDLFFAMGGDHASIKTVLAKRPTVGSLSIGDGVANTMIELAAISYIHDIDMIQATYNRLDSEASAGARRPIK